VNIALRGSIMPTSKIDKFRSIVVDVGRSKVVKAIVSTATVFGKFAIVIGILNFIVEAPERAKQRHYQSWQLINGARQSPGEAGRSIAIGVLIDDHIEMADLDLSGGTFRKKNFQTAIMPGVDFTNAKIDGSDFSCKSGLYINEYWIPRYCWCWVTNLEVARFATTSLIDVKFVRADLNDAFIGGNSTIIEKSRFMKAKMHGVTIQDSRLRDNNFNYTELQNSRWLGGTIISKNLFVGANLRDARWYGIEFQDGHGTDFTDADLSGILVSDQITPLQEGYELTESDKRLHDAKLCRTKFSNHLSTRDCR
jgi:uncharacterized protein YjbI with pentapeptide repeats